jgi:DNA-binding CsgD family transcriptional regulator
MLNIETAQPARPKPGLTPRLVSVAFLMHEGLTNREIGDRLGITEGTVKIYASRLFDITGYSRREKIVLAVERGEFGDAPAPAGPKVEPVAPARSDAGTDNPQLASLLSDDF